MTHAMVSLTRAARSGSAALLLACLLSVPGLQAQTGSTDFYGRVVDKNALCTQASGFMSEQDVERLIGEMLAMQGLKNRYIVVGCQSVTNCIATVDKDKRPVILFNPAFLQRVQKLHFSESDLPVIGERDWPTLTILAHELGHHMNNHLTNPLPDATRRGMELEADETAGFLLYLMGGQLEQGRLAFREASETGSYTHPPRAQRHEALGRGYADAAKRFPRNRGGGGTDPRPDPVKPGPVNPSRVSFASVAIGSQVWMADNLNVDRFRNGDIIPEARTEEDWQRAAANKQPAWCYYENVPAHGAIYGKLYNWYAVSDPRGLAPEGWHVPTEEEWKTLIDGLGGKKIAGGKMKSSSGWNNNKNGTNASRFNGRPGGVRYDNGLFNLQGWDGYWWSATAPTPDGAFKHNLGHLDDEVHRTNNDRSYGFSVRCLKD
jgi:uncharacterized protein (TIGR02145 family)